MVYETVDVPDYSESFNKKSKISCLNESILNSQWPKITRNLWMSHVVKEAVDLLLTRGTSCVDTDLFC